MHSSPMSYDIKELKKISRSSEFLLCFPRNQGELGNLASIEPIPPLCPGPHPTWPGLMPTPRNWPEMAAGQLAARLQGGKHVLLRNFGHQEILKNLEISDSCRKM